MNYIKEAEKYLYHYRDLYVSIENLDKEISEIVAKSAPKGISSFKLDLTGIKGTNQQDEAYNSLFKLKTLINSKNKTNEELKKIDGILKEISKDKGCELYGKVLRKWYIEKVPKEDIAYDIGYSSRKSIYNLKAKAIRKFAVRLFGLEALRIV